MTQAPHLLTGSREGFKYGDVTMRDHMAYDGLWDAFTDQPMGALTEDANTGRPGLQPRRAGRVRGPQSPAGRRRRGRTACSTTRSSPVPIPQRKGEPLEFRSDEGIRGRHHGRVAGQAAAGVPQGRHHHRRFGVADLRRRRRGRRDEQGQGRGARAAAGWPRSAPRRGRRARLHACSPSRPTRSGPPSAKEGIDVADLDLDRDQRGVRGRRPGLHARAGRRPRHRQRQRRRASPSVTRSACRARASRCTWRWSCSAGVAASARRRCAAAAARVTR